MRPFPELLDGIAPLIAGSIKFITFGGGLQGTFSDKIMPNLAGDMEWTIDYFDGSGEGVSTVTLSVQASAVPVQGAVWLFASALGLLGWSKRRVIK